MNKNKLPNDWQKTTLGDILKISSGNGLTKSKRNDEGDYLVYGGNGVTGKHNKYLFEEEKLIIGRVGVHCGNVYITKPKSWVTDNAFVVSFNEAEINKKFLLSLIGILNLNKYSVSTAQPVISQGKLYPIEISLPPLTTQLAIVSKIEELFSELDKGIEDLKTSQQQLKTYRQSVLKFAFEGKLTNKKVKDGVLPKGWNKIQIKNVALINPKLPNKELIAKETEVQFLPMKLVEAIINKIHLSEIRKFEEVLKGSYTPFIEGDVVFAKVTPCMENGKIAIVEKLKNGIGFGSSEFHVVRAGEKISNKYIFYFLIQNGFRNEAANEMTGAVGLRRVPKQFIENYYIPLPSTEEQHQIIQEIESRLNVADKMEESIAQSLLQAEALRQSILKKAFSGDLI